MIDGWGISCEIALTWMSLDFTDDQPTLVQVMAWCHQATSHYLSQCWPWSLSPYGVTRPQRVNRWSLARDRINMNCTDSAKLVSINDRWKSSKVLWHLLASNFTGSAKATILYNELYLKVVLYFLNYCHISQGPNSISTVPSRVSWSLSNTYSAIIN